MTAANGPAAESLADPVAAHVAELERALRGPARARRSMIDEVRDGLLDAAAAYRSGGLDPHRAALQAVRNFGTVREVAPLMQEELTARQGRWAALLIAVAFPALVHAWDALCATALMREPTPTPPTVQALAGMQETVIHLIVAGAVVLLATTFRRTVSPRRITIVVGLLGALAVAWYGVTVFAMCLANASAATRIVAVHPFALPAFVTSAAVLAVVIRSAVRSLQLATRPSPN